MWIFRIVVKLGGPLSNLFWVRVIRDAFPIWSIFNVLCAYKPGNSGKFYCTPFSLVCPLPCPSLRQPRIFGVSGCMPRPTSCCQHPTLHGHIFLQSALRSLLDTAQRYGAVPPQGPQEPVNKCTSLFLSWSVWGRHSVCFSGAESAPLFVATIPSMVLPSTLCHSPWPLIPALWDASQINHLHLSLCLNKDKTKMMVCA